MTTCHIAALLLAALLLPIVILAWALETRSERIQRWRREGLTWRVIAGRLGVSQSTARRWAVS
jgi:hypothetical protein